MNRGVGVTEFLTELVPEAALPLVLVLTMLAEAPLVLGVVTARFWFADRRDGLRLAVAVAAAIALMFAAKHVFDLPRPPASLRAPVSAVPAPFDDVYLSLLDTDESGFPSGHTTIAAAVYGGAALDAEDRRRWLGIAAVLVALVGGSRLLLGVHYLADVVGGVVLAALVVSATRLADRWLGSPKGALAVAAPLVLVAVSIRPDTTEVIAAAGVVVGVGVLWLSVDIPDDPWPCTVAAGERTLVAIGLAAIAATPLFVFGMTPILTFVVAVVATSAAIAVPAFDDATD